jgi:RNA polymerase sigma-70 factor (ECF subfamily)
MKEVDNNQENLKSLILQAKEGNSSAFEEIYRNYYTPLFRYILTRIKDKAEAEDMTQVVFMKIWKSIASWNIEHTSPLSFFFTVARNTLIDHFRKNSNKEIVSDEIVYNLSLSKDSGEDISKEREMKEEMRSSILKLSGDQQEIIILYYMNDLTYKEISEMIGKQEDAIRQLHSRAIKKLRDIYKK